MKQIIELWQRDCMDFLIQLPDNHFSLAIVDPPYFSGPEKRNFYGRNESITKRRTYKPLTQSWKVPSYEYFNELKRVTKKFIIFGANYYEFGSSVPGRIIWDKVNGSSSFSDCEIAMTNAHRSTRLFRYMWNGMQQGLSISKGNISRGDKSKNEKRIHPTQKPVDLYKWILTNYATAGDLILDTHLGSMSSVIACIDLGFSITGCELHSDYFVSGTERVKKHLSQADMFIDTPEIKVHGTKKGIN